MKYNGAIRQHNRTKRKITGDGEGNIKGTKKYLLTGEFLKSCIRRYYRKGGEKI